MKSTLLCIVTIISCSGCVIGDLEFYPDYQRSEVPEEEWLKDQSLNPEYQQYMDEQHRPLYKQEPPGLPPYKYHRSWPNQAAQVLIKNPNLALRISEIARKIEETNGKPVYYFKTHSLGREGKHNLNPEEQDLLPILRPNLRILDDVRFPPEEQLNLQKSEENVNYKYEHDARKDPHDHRQKNEGEEKEQKYVNRFKDAKLVNDPTEFAYPPSDPRYFEDSLPYDIPVQNPEVEENGENGKENSNPIPIENRNDEGRVYHEALMDPQDSDHSFDGMEVVVKPRLEDDTTGVYIIAIVAGISAAATVGLIAFGIGWYNLQKHVKNASDADYPAYGVTGPNKDISPSGDRRLAQSAQMYHYQHQKQQIIAMESRAAANERHGSISEADSDEENEEGDYTVYECPGLAPTGEMEIKNPLFQDDPTPAQTPGIKPSEEVQKK